MGILTLEKLREKAKTNYDSQKARLRTHYRYARSKGFPAMEAKILQSQSLEVIDRLARERDSE